MPAVTQAIDPLWLCLCPSFYTLSRRWSQLPRLTAWNAPRSAAIARLAASRSLLHYTSIRRPKQKCCVHLGRLETKRLHTSHEPSFEDAEDEHVLKQMSKTAVWEELRKASSKSDFIRVQRIIRTLVAVHGEPPSPRLYTALILANASPQHGSVQEVEGILGEMGEEGLSPDSSAYHAVLKVCLAYMISFEAAFLTAFRSLPYTRTTYFATRSSTNFARSGCP